MTLLFNLDSCIRGLRKAYRETTESIRLDSAQLTNITTLSIQGPRGRFAFAPQ